MSALVRRSLAALVAIASMLTVGALVPGPAQGSTPAPGATRVGTGEAFLLAKRYVGEDEEYHYQLWVRGTDGEENAVVTDPFVKPFAADLSPDGRKVAFTVGPGSTLATSGLYVVGVDGSKRTNLLAGTTLINTAREPDWSPDGQRLVFTAISKDFTDDLWTVRSDGTGLTRLTDCNCTKFAAPTWSPDGDRVLFSRDLYDLAVWDLTTEQSTVIYDNDPSGHVNVQEYAWSPDGRTVAFSATEYWNTVDQVLWTMPASGGTATVTARQEGRSLSSPHYSPDGTFLGFLMQSSTYDTTDKHVAWVRADGSEPHVLGLMGSVSHLDDLLDWGEDCDCSPGGRFSSLSVRARTMSDHLQVAGGLLPGRYDATVKVVVQKKKGRTWKPLQSLTVRTSELSTFSTPTRRSAGKLCRVTVSWPGDAAHDPARARTKPIAC